MIKRAMTILFFVFLPWVLAAQTSQSSMIPIPAGTFTMGSPTGESGRFNDEVQHQVSLQGFSMARYHTTLGEFRAFLEATGYRTTAELTGRMAWRNPGFKQTDNDPVVETSWYDAIAYCNWRSTQEGLTPAYSYGGEGTDFLDWPAGWNTEVHNNILWEKSSNGYRLPTEAEWEYAARKNASGVSSAVYPGANSADGIAWYFPNSGQKTHPVGQKIPNGIGLFDVSGNAWDWCWDWYQEYGTAVQVDPCGPPTGTNRVMRGGSWLDPIAYMRVANRARANPSNTRTGYGFRLCQSVVQ